MTGHPPADNLKGLILLPHTSTRPPRRARLRTAWLGATALVAGGLALGVGSPGEAVDDETRETRSPATTIAAVPPTYERDLASKLDASRSYATIKHLVEDIGPRVNGTPAERRGAEYLRDVLEPFGYQVELQWWGPVSTKRTADIVTAAVTRRTGGDPPGRAEVADGRLAVRRLHR